MVKKVPPHGLPPKLGRLRRVWGRSSEVRVGYTGEVGVTVANDGPRLPAGEEERVFEKCYRAGASADGGFGLGLPICRAIVTAHGGRIWAENLAPQGVAFHFTLVAQEQPPAPRASETGEDVPAA